MYEIGGLRPRPSWTDDPHDTQVFADAPIVRVYERDNGETEESCEKHTK